MKRPKVLIACSKAIDAVTIRELVTKNNNLNIVGYAIGEDNLMPFFNHHLPAILILDIKDYVKRICLHTLRQIKEQKPDTKVILLVNTLSTQVEMQYKKYGADMFIDKSEFTALIKII